MQTVSRLQMNVVNSQQQAVKVKGLNGKLSSSVEVLGPFQKVLCPNTERALQDWQHKMMSEMYIFMVISNPLHHAVKWKNLNVCKDIESENVHGWSTGEMDHNYLLHTWAIIRPSRTALLCFLQHLQHNTHIVALFQR